MKKLALTAAVAALLTNVAFADTYQAEAGMFYTNIDPDRASDIDVFTVSGSVYLKPVNDNKGPLFEAAFLDRASSISASYSDPQSPFDEFFTLDGRFITDTGMIVEAGYSDMFKDDTYRIGLGTYLTANSDIVVSYTRAQDSDVDTLSAAYHSVAKLAGTSSIAYSLSGGYVDATDSGYVVSGDVTYYPNPQLGIGAMVSFSDYNFTDTRSIGVQANYFLNSNFFVQGFVKTTDYNGPDEDSVGIGASLRF